MSEKVLFRWACLAVAAAALAALGWMLNDMRLQVRELAQNASDELTEVRGLTTRANNILTQTESVTKQLDDKVPKILNQTEQVTGAMNRHLPKILAESEVAVTSIANLGANFRQYKDLMAKVYANKRDAGLLNYGNGLLDLIEKNPDAVVGMKKRGTDQSLKQVMPAKQWAGACAEGRSVPQHVRGVEGADVARPGPG